MSKRDRIKACELAAKVMAGHNPDESYTPKLWSLAVFFEEYITKGATGTQKNFGPKKPVKLRTVSK